MKTLTREQIQIKLKLALQLTEAGEDLQEAIRRFNETLHTASAEIQNLQGRFNELVQEAQGFVQSIHDEQETYRDERSDRWNESDAGQSYGAWMDAWDASLEEIDLDLPDEIEEVSMEALETIRDLPDRP